MIEGVGCSPSCSWTKHLVGDIRREICVRTFFFFLGTPCSDDVNELSEISPKSTTVLTHECVLQETTPLTLYIYYFYKSDTEGSDTNKSNVKLIKQRDINDYPTQYLFTTVCSSVLTTIHPIILK